MQGDPYASPQPRAGERRRVSIQVQAPAVAGGGTEPVAKGKDAGGDGAREEDGGELAGQGGEGEGSSRIGRGDVQFRSWTDGDSGLLVLSISSREDVRGDLELVAVDMGGRVDGYELPIQAAQIADGSGTRDLTWSGNTLRDVTLAGGPAARIELHVPAGSRYRLEMK